MKLISICAFQNNYIWILVDDQRRCIVIDPGEAFPVLKIIKKNGWKIEAILLTHHHHDHIGGVSELHVYFPKATIYGPLETQNNSRTKIVNEGENICILQRNFSVLATPGHTLGHLCYYSFPYLFCGDTLFSGGCGKLFEGTPTQMYQSFQKINAFPEKSIICCAHEYTLKNMQFAKSILPGDQAINDYYQKVKELRNKNQKTLPTSLKTERKINLFFRVNDINLVSKINKEAYLQQPEERFAWLRLKKDSF